MRRNRLPELSAEFGAVFRGRLGLQAAPESALQELLHSPAVARGQRDDFRAGVHQRQGQPGNQQRAAAVHGQGHEVGQRNGPAFQAEIKGAAANARGGLLDQAGQLRGRFQQGKNELKNVDRVFQPDQKNSKADAGGHKTDNVLRRFNNRCGFVFVLRYERHGEPLWGSWDEKWVG